MRLPQDLANLLAVAIRDLIWYQNKVGSFLRECGVPEPIMVEVNRQQKTKTATIKTVHFVLEGKTKVSGPVSTRNPVFR